ncbi:hypothetical protein K4F52_001880 [Lecanicillium sp. MT-2017a]|nr:hypothetical protein K4F52_001880 [Lecanicillium sp. MT-2017a]
MTPSDDSHRHASVSSAPAPAPAPATLLSSAVSAPDHSGRDDEQPTSGPGLPAAVQTLAPPDKDTAGTHEETEAGTGERPNSRDSLPFRQKPPQVTLQAREILRLFQCTTCHKPLTEPVTLPCGRTICKTCIPRPHLRRRISYPALGDRLEGFLCPFDSCAKEHTLGDCGIDVVLNKLADHVRNEMRRRRSAPAVMPASAPNAKNGDSSAANPSSDGKATSENVKAAVGDALAALWELAEQGTLKTRPSEADTPDPYNSVVDADSVLQLQQATRPELDCQVCYALFYDPLTTGCGHTFCRSCLHRILDHSRCCPICRRPLSISSLLSRLSCPPNLGLTNIIKTLWKDELDVRRDNITADEAAREKDLDTPLFLCTLSFPQMPTFLHVFEPQYRLMIRRAMEGNKTFGMVVPQRRRRPGDAGFSLLGTLLRIENAHFYPDGRCLIETVGLSRFRVVRHSFLDGYAVSKVERVDDISLEEEEATEAYEVANCTRPHWEEVRDATLQGSNSDYSTSADVLDRLRFATVAGLDCMTTRDLMTFATTFVTRMQAQSVPWMTAQVLSIYGECPYEDPAVFPWWLGSVLPIKESEKYKLLESSSVRQRLKLCCKWIIEWESRSWAFTACSIL